MGECSAHSSLQADSKVKFAAWPTSWRPPGTDRLWPTGTTVNSRIWLAPWMTALNIIVVIIIIHHKYLSNVDAESDLSLCMVVSKLSHRCNGVKTGVLRQGEWNHVQCFCKGTETVLLHAGQRV